MSYIKNVISKQVAKLYRFVLLAGISLGITTIPILGYAQTPEYSHGLSPQTLRSVRAVSVSVLRAKRSYKPDPSVAALRNNIKTLRNQILELDKPVTTTPLQIQGNISAAKSSSKPTVQQVPISENWQQEKSVELTNLRRGIAALQDESNALQKKPVSKQSILITIWNNISGKQHSASKKNQIIKPITQQELARIDGLNAEIDAAIKMTAQKRHIHLHELADSLTFTRKIPSRNISGSDKNIETPTLSSNTQHRRKWH